MQSHFRGAQETIIGPRWRIGGWGLRCHAEVDRDVWGGGARSWTISSHALRHREPVQQCLLPATAESDSDSDTANQAAHPRAETKHSKVRLRRAALPYSCWFRGHWSGVRNWCSYFPADYRITLEKQLARSKEALWDRICKSSLIIARKRFKFDDRKLANPRLWSVFQNLLDRAAFSWVDQEPTRVPWLARQRIQRPGSEHRN